MKQSHWNDAARFLRQASRKLDRAATLDEIVSYSNAEETKSEIDKLHSEAHTLIDAALARMR